MTCVGNTVSPLVFPAASVAETVKAFMPFGKAPVVKFQAPLLFVMAVPIFDPSSKTVTVLFASAVPFNVT